MADIDIDPFGEHESRPEEPTDEHMTGFLSLCSSFPRAKFPQEVYCTIESWGDTHKRSVCLKSISGLLNH